MNETQLQQTNKQTTATQQKLLQYPKNEATMGFVLLLLFFFSLSLFLIQNRILK